MSVYILNDDSQAGYELIFQGSVDKQAETVSCFNVHEWAGS